ncbi:MAG: 16S rRNA (adenine(1518)-N(6)/adenine(1519)-N(6))-dimethyltransferase RsmA [Minisyncoccales bacterium]
MNLCSKKEIKKIFKKHNLTPIKKMGQNFLINKNDLNVLLRSANLKKEDVVLEIGPGLGVLTKELAKKVKKVIAVEKDRRLMPVLKENLSSFKNIEFINKDIRDIKIKNKKYKIVSNLPFYITGVITKDFLEKENKPKLISIIMQKEMIKRICAEPPNMNLPAISVQFYAEPKKIKYIPKSHFYPPPKVDAGIVKIVLKNLEEHYNPIIAKKDFQNKFFKIVKAGFKHKRKKLTNNLSTELNLDKDKIKQAFYQVKLKNKQRAETLKIKDWINLTKKLT